uniref:Uncharacterized protein n=1 Tax=Takifugu rubripes TaxID=31033 RepID=A0A3B5KHQ4_TAKRU
MQRSAVIVVADKTSLKRPFIFTNAVHMVAVLAAQPDSNSPQFPPHQRWFSCGFLPQLVSVASAVIMYVMEIGCLLLSVLEHVFFTRCSASVCSTYHTKRVVREESKLLSMMPLTGTNKANRTLLYSIQRELECCGLIEGYKDWGASIPPSCDCHNPGKCVPGTSASPSEETTVLTPLSLPFTSALLISQPCLPVYVSELKIAFSLAMAIQFGSGVFWVRACRAYRDARCISHIVSVLFHCRRFCWS